MKVDDAASSAGWEQSELTTLLKAGVTECNDTVLGISKQSSHQLGSLFDEAMCIRECACQLIKMCEVQSLVLSRLHVVNVMCLCRCSKGEKPYAACSRKQPVKKQPLQEAGLTAASVIRPGSTFPCCYVRLPGAGPALQKHSSDVCQQLMSGK